MNGKDSIDLQLVTLIADNPALPAERNEETPIFPARKLIFKWGDNPTSKGTFRVGHKTLSTLPILQRKYARETIPLDYEHNTVPGTDAYRESAHPREVAGHLTLSVVENEGIYVNLKSITPSGKKNIRNYSDLSPAISFDKNGEILFVSSVALTQAGSVFDLELLSVPMEGIKTDDDQKKEKAAMDYRAKLIALLNLEDTASDEAIQQAYEGVEKIKKEDLSEEERKKKEALSEEERKKKEALSGDKEEKDKTETLSHDVAAIRARLDKRDRDALIDRAHREGKVLPLSDAQIEHLPITVLSEMVENLPETVPLSQRTPGVTPHRVDASQQSATDEVVRTRLGVSKETWDKHVK